MSDRSTGDGALRAAGPASIRARRDREARNVGVMTALVIPPDGALRKARIRLASSQEV